LLKCKAINIKIVNLRKSTLSVRKNSHKWFISLIPVVVEERPAVKGSSKVLDFNTCPCYYYALHTSIYTYIYMYRKSRIGTPL